MSKVIKLADYKNIEVKVPAARIITDEDVAMQIGQMMASQSSLEPKMEGALDFGDVATLDFCGKKDGVAFDGGTASNYELEIGSHMFIPGFEEQMVGMEKGETRDLNLTFPENYQEPTLAGQAVVFTVTLHEISTKKPAELTDAFVTSLNIPDMTTVEDFKNYMKLSLEQQAQQEFQVQKENAALDCLIANSEVEVDEADIMKAYRVQLSRINMDLAQQGFTLDQYLEMMGMDEEAIKAQLWAPSTEQAKFEAIIDEIIKVEGIATTDEEVEAQIERIATANHITADDVKAQVTPEALKKDLDRVAASQAVLTNAKYVVE